MKNFALFEYINVHTHLPTGQNNVFEVTNLYFAQSPPVVQSPISLGLHPWYLGDYSRESASSWFSDRSSQGQVVAIGESGLDKVTDTDWGLQVKAFEQSIAWAIATSKPLVVHCVRAYQACLQILKAHKDSLPTVIFHGYHKNIETARPLLDAGYYLSFGKALCSEHSAAATVFAWMPADLFLLETDHASISIEDVYQRAASIRGLSLSDLQAQVRDNAKILLH